MSIKILKNNKKQTKSMFIHHHHQQQLQEQQKTIKSQNILICRNSRCIQQQHLQTQMQLQNINPQQNICCIQQLQPPSPISSSQEGSQEVQYLSYLAHVIDTQPTPKGDDQNNVNVNVNGNSNQQTIKPDPSINHQPSSSSSQCQIPALYSINNPSHFQKAQYMHLVYQSAIYLRKDSMRTQTDDNLFFESFIVHFHKEKLHPLPLDKIGQLLLSNGYFLASYAVCSGRLNNSNFLIGYLLQNFKKQANILMNKEEFIYFINKHATNEQILSLLLDKNIGKKDLKRRHSTKDTITTNNIFYTPKGEGQDIIIIQTRQPNKSIKRKNMLQQLNPHHDQQNQNSITIRIHSQDNSSCLL